MCAVCFSFLHLLLLPHQLEGFWFVAGSVTFDEKTAIEPDYTAF